MAVSNPDENFNKKIEETVAFVDNTKEELEKQFGMLYIHGKPRNMSETEKQKLAGMCDRLEELQKCIEIFQKDLFQICANGAENCLLKPVERRTPKGRTQRESGYSSAGYLSQVYNSTPDQSSNRLSTADSNTVSTEEAELFNPSISGLDSSASKECLPKHGVTFYSQSPPPSTTSLTNVNELDPLTHSCNSNSEQESNTSPSDIQTEPNELNDLSKPSSEEDNTKLADDSCSSTK